MGLPPAPYRRRRSSSVAVELCVRDTPMAPFPAAPSPSSHDPSSHDPALVRVEVLRRPDRTVVLLHGEVDLTAHAPLVTAVEAARSRPLPVVVDASDVTFMDCAGLAEVLALGRAGQPLSLAATSPCVQLLLDAAAGTDLPLTRPGAAEGAAGHALQARPATC